MQATSGTLTEEWIKPLAAEATASHQGVPGIWDGLGLAAQLRGAGSAPPSAQRCSRADAEPSSSAAFAAPAPELCAPTARPVVSRPNTRKGCGQAGEGLSW